MIKIDFEFETEYGSYKDALHLPYYHTYSDAEIEAMKQARVDNWLAIINTPSPEVVQEVSTPSNTVEIAGETYQLLEGTPMSGAKLIEISGSWYYKV